MLVLGVSWNLRGWSGSAAFQVLEARYGASQRQLGRGLRAVQRIPPCKTDKGKTRAGQGQEHSQGRTRHRNQRKKHQPK